MDLAGDIVPEIIYFLASREFLYRYNYNNKLLDTCITIGR